MNSYHHHNEETVRIANPDYETCLRPSSHSCDKWAKPLGKPWHHDCPPDFVKNETGRSSSGKKMMKGITSKNPWFFRTYSYEE